MRKKASGANLRAHWNWTDEQRIVLGFDIRHSAELFSVSERGLRMYEGFYSAIVDSIDSRSSSLVQYGDIQGDGGFLILDGQQLNAAIQLAQSLYLHLGLVTEDAGHDTGPVIAISASQVFVAQPPAPWTLRPTVSYIGRAVYEVSSKLKQMRADEMVISEATLAGFSPESEPHNTAKWVDLTT